MKSLIDSTDPALLRLAHPLRCAAVSETFDIMERFVGPAVWERMRVAFQEDRLTSEIVSDLCAKRENAALKMMLEASTQMAGGTEVGNAYSSLLYLRHAMCPQPYFVVEDSLVEMLENSDIADDIPIEMIQVPYGRFYVELGKERKTTLQLPNTVSGQHILEGAYIERGVNAVMGEGLFILLTGSPIGKEGVMDDATHSLFLPLKAGYETIREALGATFKLGHEISLEHGLTLTPDFFKQHAFASVQFLVKVLLYLALPEARSTVHKDRTTWVKSTASLQSPAKKAKAAKRGRGLVDHILVSVPANAGSTDASTPTGRTLKFGWRRRHFRMQAHGPKHSLRKMILIEETTVRRDLRPEDRGEAPVYKVK